MGRGRVWLSVALAAVLVAAVLDVGVRGAGPLPPLGPAFNPVAGVWSMARTAAPPRRETLRVAGLDAPVSIAFDARGTAYIDARTDHDLFEAMGYVEARNRLFQMDLMRRQGEGLLSQVVGPAALASDEFELQLGLVRTARANWQALPRTSAARAALLAYAAGVNDVIRADERDGTLPAAFRLLGYEPAPWTPIDSLIVQGDMTQDLAYTTAPIEYDLLQRHLGAARARAWLPVSESGPQHPYDTGPYLRLPLAAMPSQTAVQSSYDLAGGVPDAALSGPASYAASVAAAAAPRAARAALAEVATLAATVRHSFADSNNWAVSGRHTASGQAMLAGDPHLTQTLPAIWYQMAGRAPGYDFSGVSIPGVPVILIGYNRDIAWSLTNVQNQVTFFYRERMSPAHPGAYLWHGAWRPMRHVTYTIPVKGARPVALTVRLTVDGPLIRQSGETLAVDWAGALPSDDTRVLMSIMAATDFAQFRSALRAWHSPSQNFVYADRRGNVGLISAGYYPEVAAGRPYAVLSGTGGEDVAGTIAFAAIPHAYDPPGGLVFSANQREVTNAYPYYVGTEMDFFDPGFRADEIYATLAGARGLTPASFARLQTDTRDLLAARMVPELLAALRGRPLTPTQAAARRLLVGWNGTMGVAAPQATIWWYFLDRYVVDTFGPWWTAERVPVGADPNLALSWTSEVATPLMQDLEAWTATDPTNPAFTAPGGTRRTAGGVMARAFDQAVAGIAARLGPDPSTWRWGRVHAREFRSLLGVSSLSYGPRPSSGDPFTVDAADGGLTAGQGPSWRMIVTWTRTGAPLAEGVYPGGQSENPASPLYADEVATWWAGRYDPMHLVGQPGTRTGAVWRLTS